MSYQCVQLKRVGDYHIFIKWCQFLHFKTQEREKDWICVCLFLCACPHCLTVQLLFDFNDTTFWFNGKLVVLISADNGVEDGSIHMTVNILCFHLQKHTYIEYYNSHVKQSLKDVKMGRGAPTCKKL